MKKIKVGLIGCGAIGSALAKAIEHPFADRAVLVCLCDRFPEKAQRLRKKLKTTAAILPWKKLIRKSDLILEAASSDTSGRVALESLRLGKQVLIMSVGGLLEPEVLNKIFQAGRGQLWIPSGAIAGVDALLAAREGKIRRVRLKTQKPPQSLRSAPYFKQRVFPELKDGRPQLVFKGTAVEAVKAFPQNINVSGILSLAGLGPRKTHVEIWTSRNSSLNQHEVVVEGDFGSIYTVTRNVPSRENPKTSHLAILSAKAVLRKIFSNIRIGT